MGAGPVGIRDRFANVAALSVTLSAANTLTFGSLQTNMGFLGRRDQALAMAIDEIQYGIPLAMVAEFNATGDDIIAAITDSDLPTDLEDLTDRRILDYVAFERQESTAVGFNIFEFPSRKQFFPPLITAARTLFLGVNSTGLASAHTIRARILFRVETLTGAELVELSEAFRLTG